MHKPYGARYHYIDSLKQQYKDSSLASFANLTTVLSEWAARHGDEELAAEFSLAMMRWRFDNVYLDDGKDIERNLLSLLSHVHRIGARYAEAGATQILGSLYRHQKKFGQAIEQYISAYNLYSGYGLDEFPPKRSYVYEMGSMYMFYGESDKALRFLREAERLPETYSGNFDNPIDNSIGILYRRKEQYDSAIWYFRKILARASHDRQREWQGIAKGNIGVCYLRQKNYKDAIPLLEEDISTSLEMHQVKNAVASMYYLASLHFEQHEFDRAGALLHRALDTAERRQFWPDYKLAEEIFLLLSQVYAAQHDIAKAYVYLDSERVAKDSLMAQLMDQGLAKATERVEMVQRKLEQERVQGELRLQETIRNCLLGGIVLISVIGMLFINRQRLKRKKAEAEKKNAESELNTAQKLLDNFRQSVQEKNNLLEQFEGEIALLRNSGTAQVDEDVLLKLQQSTILTDEQWEDFRVLFEKVHKGFFRRVKEKMPELTFTEIRFLALSKLKLSPREMASMLGISVNSIRNYRLRLRRKLELDEEASIEQIADAV